MKHQLVNRPIKALYVHIPYCEHICFYCDFVKVIKPKDDQAISVYLDQLEAELASYGSQLDFLESIYVGGGTPSCLNEVQTTRMCEILKKYVKDKDFEYTIELNPESVTEAKLKIYQAYQINRLSMGVQTFDNDLLKKIGRIHDNQLAIKKFNLARQVGFTNISIDLMYNLFDQTQAHIKTDLDYISQLRPEHISWYSLIMKESSVWGKKQLKVPGNDELFDEVVNAGLKKLGYQRYEISNYCLDNRKSHHNLAYWNNSLFAGVGIGATGFEFVDGSYCLTKNQGSVLAYHKEYEKLSQTDYYFQILMMGLRLLDGIDLTDQENQKMLNNYQTIIEQKVMAGLLEVTNNYLKCTPRGFDIMNEILIDFL